MKRKRKDDITSQQININMCVIMDKNCPVIFPKQCWGRSDNCDPGIDNNYTLYEFTLDLLDNYERMVQVWYQFLDNTKFLQMLYYEIPPLVGINITNLLINDCGNRIKLIFEMSQYVDYPPQKWGTSNTASVEIDFTGVRSLSIDSGTSDYNGNIEMTKNSNGLLEIVIQGTLNLKMLVEVGHIQRIDGYVKKESESNIYN